MSPPRYYYKILSLEMRPHSVNIRMFQRQESGPGSFGVHDVLCINRGICSLVSQGEGQREHSFI